MDTINNTLKDFVSSWKNKPWFPLNYCNPASAELKKILDNKWITTKRCFSYKKPGDWHTFLRDEQWNIIDPTYGQFDQNYPNWFVWESFPDEELNFNEIDPEWFMMIQQKRFEDWIYDNLQ